MQKQKLVAQLQGKDVRDYWQPLGWRRRGTVSLEPSEGVLALPTSDFQTSSLQNYERINLVVLSHFCVHARSLQSCLTKDL